MHHKSTFKMLLFFSKILRKAGVSLKKRIKAAQINIRLNNAKLKSVSTKKITALQTMLLTNTAKNTMMRIMMMKIKTQKIPPVPLS